MYPPMQRLGVIIHPYDTPPSGVIGHSTDLVAAMSGDLVGFRVHEGICEVARQRIVIDGL